jgi:hypothetical protein
MGTTISKYDDKIKLDVSKYEKKICSGKPIFPMHSWGFAYDGLVIMAKIAFFVLIAILLVYFSRKKFDTISIISVCILAFMFFLIFMMSSHSYLGNSLPFATYPLPPHLGLDGVSNEVRNSY